MLLKPGLGKTAITLTALLLLRAQRTLVVVPAQVAASEVWSQEAAAWAHTAHMRVVELVGDAKKRDIQLMLGADIFVVSYDNLVWLTDALPRDYFDAIVYDELSKMKHPGTKRFRRMRAWAHEIPVRFGLTGSPMGNHWLDLWGEMYIVHGGAPLGETFTEYRDTYFTQPPGQKYRWELRHDGSDEIIRRRVKPYAFSINAKLAASELPAIITNPIRLEVPEPCRQMEAQLRMELETQLASGTTLLALNQSKLATACRQFASGAVYTGETGDTSAWEEVHTAKLDALAEIIDEQQGEPLLVFTWFKHEAARLLARFRAELLSGDARQVQRWNNRQIPILLAHPQGSGHGLNLQRGSSSVCWFTLPWSRELFDQGNGRLARIGQQSPHVTAHLLLAGAVDRRVWSRVQEKGADEAGVMAAVEM